MLKTPTTCPDFTPHSLRVPLKGSIGFRVQGLGLWGCWVLGLIQCFGALGLFGVFRFRFTTVFRILKRLVVIT